MLLSRDAAPVAAGFPMREEYDGEAKKLFLELEWTDMCEDASLVEVAHFLRGCTGLKIPEGWRPLLPTRL